MSLTAVALAALALPAAAAKRSSYGCHPPHATTIAHSRTTRIFDRRVHADNNVGYHILVYGCLYSRGRPISLGYDDVDLNTYADHFRLAGPYAAYASGEYDDFGNQSDVVRVVDLRTGHHRYASDTFTGRDEEGADSAEDETMGIVLKRNGSVAWIGAHRADVDGMQRPTRFEVHRIDGRGKALLDSGTGIGPRSLKRRGSSVSWVRDGQTVTADLR